MRFATLALVLAGMLALLAPSAQAQNTGSMHFDAQVDYVSNYYFRGLLRENNQLIIQPQVGITVDLIDREAWDLKFKGGVFNSVHENRTGAITPPAQWFEERLYGGLDLNWGDFTIGAVYTLYTFPNGALSTIHEVGAKIAWDDAKTMKEMNLPFSLNPYVAVYYEANDENAVAHDDWYAEAGIKPAFNVPVGDKDLTLSIPVTAGFSLDGYYQESSGQNSVFGYVAIGAEASVPLPMPERLGKWHLSGGVTYMLLCADSLEAANGNEHHVVTGKLGIGFTY